MCRSNKVFVDFFLRNLKHMLMIKMQTASLREMIFIAFPWKTERGKNVKEKNPRGCSRN